MGKNARKIQLPQENSERMPRKESQINSRGKLMISVCRHVRRGDKIEVTIPKVAVQRDEGWTIPINFDIS